MADIDTGDTVLHRPSGQRHEVACVHGEFLYTIGVPEYRLLVESCEIVSKASPALRQAQIEIMSRSSAPNIGRHHHRPSCARERLRVEAAHE